MKVISYSPSGDGKYRVLLYGDYAAAVVPEGTPDEKELEMLREGIERIRDLIEKTGEQ